MTGTKVEAIHHHGVPATDGFVVGRVLSAEQHPDADRLKVCAVQLDGDGGEPVSIVCGAPNVAGGQTVAVARPGAVMPDGTKLRQAKLRGVTSDGMILSESELEIGAGGEGILVLDELTVDAELAPGTPLESVLPISFEVLELEITPNRPDCLGVYGVARELHAATGAPLSEEPWTRDPGSFGELAGAEVQVAVPRPLPPLHRARIRGRQARALAAVAESAPDRRRAAHDQQRRRHHQLRDAAHRAAAARLRPRPRGGLAADGPPRHRGRAGADARRPDPHPRRRDGRDRGRPGPDLDRRPDGRSPLGGAGRHDQGADGGRNLERPQHPPQLVGPGPAQRGLLALREGARARAVHSGPGGLRAADGRAVRREHRPRHDRRRRRASGARSDPPAQRARAGDPRRGGRSRAPGRDPAGTRLRGR